MYKSQIVAILYDTATGAFIFHIHWIKKSNLTMVITIIEKVYYNTVSMTKYLWFKLLIIQIMC